MNKTFSGAKKERKCLPSVADVSMLFGKLLHEEAGGGAWEIVFKKKDWICFCAALCGSIACSETLKKRTLHH